MKIIKIVVIIMFLFFPFVMKTQPIIQIEGGNSYDWGKVKSTQETVKAKIRIKNIGTDTLKIYKVKPNCGCTATDLKNAKIPPDSSVYMNIELNIANYSGPVVKSIEIRTSDPEARSIRYDIKANVVQPLSFFPDKFLRFSTALAGAESKYTIVINNNTPEDVTIHEIKKEPNYLQINLVEGTIIKAGDSFVLDAVLNPQTIGNLLVNIKFKTTCPDLPRVEIGGSAMVIDYSPNFKKQESDVQTKEPKKRLELK